MRCYERVRAGALRLRSGVTLAAGLLLSACSGSAALAPEPAPLVAPPSAPSAPAVAEPLEAPAPTDSAPKLELTPLEPRYAETPEHNLEIKFPISGQRVLLSKAAKYAVRLQLDGVPRGVAQRVEIRLDDNQPSVVDPAKPVTLKSLLDADQELTAGEHLLFAVALDAAGAPLMSRPEWSRGPEAWVRFGVDTREVSAPAPVVRLLSPRGTFNGAEQAKAAKVEFRVSPAFGRGAAHAARLRITGMGASLERELKDARPLALGGLESGDFRVEIELLDAAGAKLTSPGARDEQTITVNLDAPLP